MHPILIDSYYCFDSLQVRYLAKVLHDAPIKDSVITNQDKKIKSLDEIVTQSDSIIGSYKIVVKNDSIAKSNFKAILSKEKEARGIEVSNERKKSKRAKLIAIIEGVLIFTILLLK